jgi:uncharacterized protein YybS (DUF2232 family)
LGNRALEQPAIGDIIRTIIFATVALVLPGLKWTLFGWLHIFLPLLSFYVLSRYGEYSGRKLLATSALISSCVYLIASSIDLFVFAVILLLSGFVLFKSAQHNDSPSLSGGKCAATLAIGWISTITVFSFGQDVHAYNQLIQALDGGVTEALLYYRQTDNISAETLAVLETTLYQMKVIVPIIMPAVLGSLVLLMTWFTMVFGNLVLFKSRGIGPWPKYQIWQLPDKLIWVVILAGACALIPVSILRIIGINALILLSIVYSFQGLSIGVFFMTKWNVPLLFRSFFYVMVVFQSFGTILLLFAGIADIWFDFRKLKIDSEDQTME